MRSKFVLAALFLAAAVQGYPQTAPAGREGASRLFVGGGVSGYNANFYGDYLIEGATIWIDFYPNVGPKFLRGLGIEAEGRDICFGRPSDQPSNLAEQTGGGGAIYSWRHFHNFAPYAKFQWEHANIDFDLGIPNYGHDTRDLYAGGVGVDYRISRYVWVRAGYEQQFWQRLFQNHAVSTPTGIVLKPQGVTIGAEYNVHLRHRH
jgi:opacity protein-like surface antigen